MSIVYILPVASSVVQNTMLSIMCCAFLYTFLSCLFLSEHVKISISFYININYTLSLSLSLSRTHTIQVVMKVVLDTIIRENLEAANLL